MDKDKITMNDEKAEEVLASVDALPEEVVTEVITEPVAGPTIADEIAGKQSYLRSLRTMQQSDYVQNEIKLTEKIIESLEKQL